MSLNTELKERSPTVESFRYFIDQSNKIAGRNLNLYPIQEQAVLKEIWCQKPSSSDEGEKSKSPSKVYVLKEGLTFYDVKVAYLKMFVYRHRHGQLLNLLSQAQVNPELLNSRIKGAYIWLKYLQDNWDMLYALATIWNRSLFDKDFIPTEVKANKLWDFTIDESIYRSKLWAILFPDICIAMDSRSRKEIKRYFKESNLSYADLLTHLHTMFHQVLSNGKLSIQEFRKLDQPGKYVHYESNLISLRNQKVDYGDDYEPEERPISRILDKFFYDPGSNSAKKPI